MENMAKRGRPTKYRAEYCDQMIAYFEAARDAPTRELAPVTTDIEGEKASKKIEVRRICAELPTFEGFAVSIKVPSRTFNDWVTAHEEFSQAHARAKDIQYQILVDRGLTRQYDPAAFAFVAKNITWMKDRVAQEISGPDGGPVALAGTITIELVRAKDGREQSEETAG
jgi:DNA-packaging protein gp3